MAAPMARAALRTCRNVSARSIDNFKQFQLPNKHHARTTPLCSQSRPLHRFSCVYSPRIIRRTPSIIATSEPDDHDGGDENATMNRLGISGSPRSVDNESRDVHIHGDSTEATVPYRRRAEREIWSKPVCDNDNGPSLHTSSSAKEVAMKFRKELIEKRKAGKKTDSHSSAENKEADQSAADPKRKDVDSKGFRTLKHQVQDLRRFQESTVASILYRSVIYNEGELVAIDKPYGLPSHGGPGVVHSVDSLLPLLAKRLKLDKGDPEARLHMVHRLDKETTGVMLLAKTEEMAQRLHRMFVGHRVGKTYLVVTVGVPQPGDGVIDMPMAEREVAGRYRMGIRPDVGAVYGHLGRSGRSKGGTKAVTNFRVVSENGNAALVEVKPETGVKHQIRVHMALGMACPILGDHKYSHHDKLAPQRLPMSILQSLGIRQAKARTVPMHLHAKEVTLPDFLDGHRNLYISTRVPKFFQQNMRRLKLKFP